MEKRNNIMKLKAKNDLKCNDLLILIEIFPSVQ